MDTNKLKAQLAAMQDEINRTAEHYGLGGHLQYMMNGGEIHHLPVMPYGFAKDGTKTTKSYTLEELAKERGVSTATLKKEMASMKPGQKFGLKLNDPISFDAPEQGSSDMYYSLSKGDKYTLGPDGRIYEGNIPTPNQNDAPAPMPMPTPMVKQQGASSDFFKRYSINPYPTSGGSYPGIAPDNFTTEKLAKSYGSDSKFLNKEISKLKPGQKFNMNRGDGENSYGGIQVSDKGIYTVGPNGQVFASNDPRIKNIDFSNTPVAQPIPTAPPPSVVNPNVPVGIQTPPAVQQRTPSKTTSSTTAKSNQPVPKQVVARTPVATPKQVARPAAQSYMTNTTVYSPNELKSMELNQATSIVDAMKLMGDDSSFANRKKIAEEKFGIKNYTGTADQNKELMQKYYASKRQFTDNTTPEEVQALNVPTEIGMPSKTPQLIPTSGMERPTPELPFQMSGAVQGFPEVQDIPATQNTFNPSLVSPERSQMTFPGEQQMQTKEPGLIPTSGGRPAPEVPSFTMPSMEQSIDQPLEPIREGVQSGIPFATNTPALMQTGMGAPYATNAKSVVESDFPKSMLPEPTAINTDKVVNSELDKKIKKSKTPVVVNPNELSSIVRASIIEAAKRNNGRFIVTDKGSKATYYGTVENGKIKFNKNEVLTGQNDKPTMNTNDYSYRLVHEDPSKRVTPVGAFATSRNEEIYGQPGINLEGTDLAVHATANPQYRNQFYNNNKLSDNNQSMGCINNKCYDMTKLMKFYDSNGNNQNDSVYVIDSRLTPEQNAVLMNKNKHTRVISQNDGVVQDVNDWMKKNLGFDFNDGGQIYYSGGEIENDPHIMELYGFANGGQIMELPIAPYGYAEQGMEIPVAPYGYNRQGGMNYEDGGQMPVDVAVARFKAAGKDKGLSGGELQVYVEKMKSKYNYQKGGVVKEQELGNYEVGMYGSGGIMYNGTKFPGYNRAINTLPGDKFKKQMLLQKGGKIKLVKFGHR